MGQGMVTVAGVGGKDNGIGGKNPRKTLAALWMGITAVDPEAPPERNLTLTLIGPGGTPGTKAHARVSPEQRKPTRLVCPSSQGEFNNAELDFDKEASCAVQLKSHNNPLGGLASSTHPRNQPATLICEGTWGATCCLPQP